MKKWISALCMALILAVGLAFPGSALAAQALKDGSYEVPVQLIHESKDKTSLGNQYIGQTALLKVKGSQYQIYIVPSSSHIGDFDKVKFFYYVNGTLEGATKEAGAASNIKIAGKTYAAAATFTLPTKEEYVPMKFKASMMPLTPSARLRISYSSAKLVSEAAAATKKQASVTKTSAAAAPKATAPTQKPAASTTTTAPHSSPSSTTSIIASTTTLPESAITQTPQATNKTEKPKKNSPLKWWLTGGGVVIALAGLSIVFFKKK